MTVRRTRAAPILRAVAVMAIVLIADRITKHLVKTHIQPGQSKHVFSWLHLVHDQNNGVAFGFLSGGGALVVIITAAVALALIVFFLRGPDRPWLWLSTGLLAGGAVGNLLDRLLGRLGDRLHQAAALARLQRLGHRDHDRRDLAGARARGPEPARTLVTDGRGRPALRPVRSRSCR